MANLVKHSGSYSTPKNILIGQESYYMALPIVVSWHIVRFLPIEAALIIVE